MSLTEFPAGARPSHPGVPLPKVTMPALSEMKRQGKPISALTAYDYATARLVDEAGIDLILVGDSLAMVVLGHENTLAVTVDEMLHHTRAVRRAVRRALVVADMPFGSYHGSISEAVANAVRFVKEAGAEAVKIEGPRVELVRALVDAEIPVVGHLGLTPQSVHRMGGYRVQARTAESVRAAQGRCPRARCAPAPAPSCLKAFRAKPPRPSPPRCPFPPSASAPAPIATARFSSSTISSNLTFAPAAKFVRRYADASALLPLRHRALPRRRRASRLPVRRGELPPAGKASRQALAPMPRARRLISMQPTRS